MVRLGVGEQSSRSGFCAWVAGPGWIAIPRVVREKVEAELSLFAPVGRAEGSHLDAVGKNDTQRVGHSSLKPKMISPYWESRLAR